MGIFEGMGLALSALFSPLPFIALMGGVLVGLASGALPATGLPGLIVLIGVAYGMDPVVALPLAAGMLAPVATSDTLPSVMLGVPGSVASQATIIDGYTMAKQGRAGEALAAAYFASLIGGVTGAVILIISVPVAREVLKWFAAPEFLMLVIVGIGVVGVVSSGALVKGLIAGAIGLALGTVGLDVAYGAQRFTFGTPYLYSGISIITAVIGIFAIPELLGLAITNRAIGEQAGALTAEEMSEQIQQGRGAGVRAVLRSKFLVVRSVILGVFVGMLPGVGTATVDWLVYAQARATEKGASETFGTGDIRGVIAPESANNATTAAAFIPTLALGIPGSFSMAIFLGFLLVIGILPGPAMLNENVDLTFLIAFSLLFANIIGAGTMLMLSPQLAKLAFIRSNLLVPVILAILAIAAFTASNSIWDLPVLFVFSVVGWHMKRKGWARPPFIIALVLSPQLDQYMGLSLQAYSFESLVTRPQVWIIIAVSAGVAIFASRSANQARAVAERHASLLDEVTAAPSERGEAEQQ